MLDIKKPNNAIQLKDCSEIFPGSQYTLKHFELNFVKENENYKILTPADIQNGLINWSNIQEIKKQDKKLDKFLFKKGDIVITSKSSKVKIAVICDDSTKK